MLLGPPANRPTGGTVAGSTEVDEQHIAEPGLGVVDITAAAEDTVATVMEGLQQQWATSGITPVWHWLSEDLALGRPTLLHRS